MKYYLSGKIMGDPGYMEKFAGYEARYRNAGIRVVNPAMRERKGWAWQRYMKRGIRLLMKCGGIIMLPDWESSDGAVLEHEIACRLGFTVIYAASDK